MGPRRSWMATLRHEAADVPTAQDMTAKVEALRAVRMHQVTDAEIDYMLSEKSKVPAAVFCRRRCRPGRAR